MIAKSDLDQAIDTLIESGDVEKMQSIVERLSFCLDEAKIVEEVDVSIEDEEIKKDEPLSPAYISTEALPQVQEPPTAPVSSPQKTPPVTTTPANLQAKSVSVHGNSVIIDGVINTGRGQTSCYLIPIDINNVAHLPGWFIFNSLSNFTQCARL